MSAEKSLFNNFTKKMNCVFRRFTIAISFLHFSSANEQCNIECPTKEQSVACGFDAENNNYKMFASSCALSAFTKCNKVEYVETPIEFCIKHHNKMLLSRRMYGESCPVFCPSHYRPVCGSSKIRSYNYRTFNNGCYLDMLNCRGEDEDLGYVEVPLEYCQKHLMKNIFKEQVLMGGMRDYRDYE